MLPLVVGTVVVFVDYMGEGYHHPNWPAGFMITHGCKGEVIKIEAGYRDPYFQKNVPEKPQIAWDWCWFLRKMVSLGYKVPDSAYANHGPVEWSYKLHVMRQDDMTKEEVRRVQDIRAKVQEILHQWHWKTVLSSFPDCPIRAWLVENYPNPQDEKRLPGDVPAVVRTIAAYEFLVREYEHAGNEPLMQRYERQRDAALAELDHKLDELTPERTSRKPTPSEPSKEAKVMAKSNGGAAVPKKAAKAAPVVVKAGKGGKFTKEMVTEVIRGAEATPNSIAKTVAETFDVKLDKARIADAPNPGVMKMRAGNLVRGQLKREGRLA